MSKEAEKPNAVFHHQEHSDTAASASNPLYPTSGPMPYRVMVASGTGMFPVVVNAATGDDAAALAHAENPGCKVVLVEPAPQKKAA